MPTPTLRVPYGFVDFVRTISGSQSEEVMTESRRL